MFSCESQGGSYHSFYLTSLIIRLVAASSLHCPPSLQWGCSFLSKQPESILAVISLQFYSARSRGYSSPRLSLRLSGRTCILCGQLRGPPLGGKLASPYYSQGAAAENAPECISSSMLAFPILFLYVSPTHTHTLHPFFPCLLFLPSFSSFSCWASSSLVQKQAWISKFMYQLF